MFIHNGNLRVFFQTVEQMSVSRQYPPHSWRAEHDSSPQNDIVWLCDLARFTLEDE